MQVHTQADTISFSDTSCLDSISVDSVFTEEAHIENDRTSVFSGDTRPLTNVNTLADDATQSSHLSRASTLLDPEAMKFLFCDEQPLDDTSSLTERDAILPMHITPEDSSPSISQLKISTSEEVNTVPQTSCTASLDHKLSPSDTIIVDVGVTVASPEC